MTKVRTTAKRTPKNSQSVTKIKAAVESSNPVVCSASDMAELLFRRLRDTNREMDRHIWVQRLGDCVCGDILKAVTLNMVDDIVGYFNQYRTKKGAAYRRVLVGVRIYETVGDSGPISICEIDSDGVITLK